MHNHDYELIMALAEGSLDPAAAAAARAEIDACPECSQDLELQIEGLQALQTLPAAALTELESARLHRELRRELGIIKPLASQPAARRRVPLAALATAAAVLLAVVVAGPGLNLIGGDADQADSADIAAAPTTAAAATTAAPAGDLGMALPEAGGAGDDAADRSPNEAAAAPTTELAAAVETTTTVVVVTEGDGLTAYFSDESPDLASFRLDLAALEFEEEAARSNALKAAGDSILEEDPGAAQACVAVTLTSEENFIEGFQVARSRLDGREVLIVVYLAEDLEESEVIAHAADNCEELARAGP